MKNHSSGSLKEGKLSADELIKKGKEVVAIESVAVNALIDSVNEDFVKAVNAIYTAKGRVVLTGMGKSGLIARKIVATMNSTGTPAIYLHPTDALHGDLGMVRKEDVIILISKSGNTEEIVHLIPMLKRMGVILIGLTSNRSSKLGEECDIVLDINVKEEACPYDLAPTASSTATLVMGDALSIVLLEIRGFTKEDFALLHPGGSLGKRLSLKISEIMYKGKDVPIVNCDTPLKDALFEITSKRLGVTAVTDNEGKLVGIITDGDLRRLLEKTTDVMKFKASEVMTKHPKTISKDFLASFALQQMESFKITSLVVVDGENKPVGIVHLHDLVKLGLQTR
jgi:arabinose-5-phosphate isomerase